MRTKTARFDKRITFLQPIEARDPRFNGRVKQFVPAPGLKNVAAQVYDLAPSREERISDGVDLRLRPCRIRLRYREGLSADMRVQFRGREMEIVGGPAEFGRREMIELVCQDPSTLGNGP